MKSDFFLLCSLAPRQQVKLNGHSRLGCRGKVLLCNTGKKKRLKPASFSDQPDSWPGFSKGTLSLGYHRKLSYRLPGCSGVTWAFCGSRSPLERAKVSGECSVSRAKSWFSHSSWCTVRLSAAISVLLLLFMEGWCNVIQQLEDLSVPGISVRNCSGEEDLEMMLSFLEISFWPVLERASLVGNSKPSSIRSWLGIWGHYFLGAF